MEILLTQMICGRNDNYLGNFKTRLELSVNYMCANIEKNGHLEAFELLICDWNSETPLRQALNLNEAARRCVSFVEILPATVKRLGLADLPMVGSVALNAAARRSRGKMLLFTPADVLFPQASVRNLFALLRGETDFPADIHQGSWVGVERYMVPWPATERLNLAKLDRYLLLHTKSLPLLPGNRPHGRSGGEGAHLISRDTYFAAGGFDESYRPRGFGDIEMGRRLSQFAPQIKATLAGVFCYDLGQRPYLRRVLVAVKDRVSLEFNPSEDDWGLDLEELSLLPALHCPEVDNSSPPPAPYDAGLFSDGDPRPPRRHWPLIRGWKALLKWDLINDWTWVADQLTFWGDLAKNCKWFQPLSLRLLRLAFQTALHQWLDSRKAEKYSISDWFGTTDQLRGFLELALGRYLATLTPAALSYWTLGRVYAFIATVGAVARRRPRNFLFAPLRNWQIAQAAALVEPTVEILGYDHWQGERRDLNWFGSILNQVNFQGRVDLVTGPMHTALQRIKQMPLVGGPFDCACLDLNYLATLLTTLDKKLADLLAPDCALVAYGTSEQVEPFIAAMAAQGFQLAGRLSNIVILSR